MKLMSKIFQKWNKKEEVETDTETISALSFDEAVEVVFLILPYIKVLKKVKAEYKSDSSLELYREITQNLLEQLDKASLQKILGIIFKLPKTNELYISDLINILPRFIKQNNLYEIYLLLDKLGVLD